jgi:hypothetical protein
VSRREAAPIAGSAKARRYAAAILAVLAGDRTTAEGSEMMGVTLPRYYALESRAIEGMVGALEPKPKGRKKTVERELLEAKEENRRLAREISRAKGLLRTAHRSLGVTEPAKKPAGKRKARKPGRTGKAIARLVRPGDDSGRERVGDGKGAGAGEEVAP